MNKTEGNRDTKKKAVEWGETEFNGQAIARDITNLLAQHKVPVGSVDTIIDALNQEIGQQTIQPSEMGLTSEEFIRHFLEHDFGLQENPQQQ